MHHLRALLPVAWYSLWLAKHNDVNDITLTSIFPFLSSRSFHACFRAGVRAHTELPLTQINLLKSLVPVARTIIPTTFAYTTSTDTWQYCIYFLKDGILRRKSTARNTGRFISAPCLPIIFDPARRAGDLTSGVARTWDWVRNVVFTSIRSKLNFWHVAFHVIPNWKFETFLW